MYSDKLKADLDKQRPKDVPFSWDYLQVLATQLGFRVYTPNQVGNPVQLYKDTEVAVVCFYEDDRHGFAVFDSTKPLISWSLDIENGEFTWRPYAHCTRSGGNVVLWSDVDGQIRDATGLLPVKVDLALPEGECVVTMPVPKWASRVEEYICYMSEARELAATFVKQLFVSLKLV